MKKCNKCNATYDNNINFCKKCGETLTQMKEKKKVEVSKEQIKKNRTTLKYILGGLFVLAGIGNLSRSILFGLFGILFGLSIFPITYDLLNKIEIIKTNEFIQKNSKIIKILIPILLCVIWISITPPKAITTITINDYEQVIAINEEYEIDFFTDVNDIDKKDFIYTSSNEKIAIIKDGIIKGISEGEVTITIKSKNGIEASEDYIIKNVEVEDIQLKGNNNLIVGESNKIDVEFVPKNASDSILNWNSSNPEIIEIDNKGNAKAKALGNSTITITTKKGKTKDFIINVYVGAETIEVTNNNLKIEVGKTENINIVITPNEYPQNQIIWSSSNSDIASVENGIVKGISEGQTTIIAKTINNKQATIDVEIYEVKPEEVKLNKKEIKLSVGNSATISAIVTPNNASNKSVSWSSSDSSIASVENGVIKANKIGNATITAETTNGKTASIKVTATKQSPVKINNFRYTKDSVCGVEWTFSIKNNSNKSIDYVTLTWINGNRVGDLVFDQITGENKTTLRYTGPLKAGASSGSRRNTTKFYSCDYSGSTFTEVIVDYSDGTSETINLKNMSYYSNLY